MTVRRSVLGLALVSALALLGPASAAAVTITPTTTADEYNENASACSLREAIESANNDSVVNADGCEVGSGQDVIALGPGVYALTRAGAEGFNVSGDLDIATDGLAIEATGPGAVIDGNGAVTGDRAIEIPNFATGVEVEIRGITIRNGGTDTVTVGGGIAVNGITNGGHGLSLVDSTIEGNRAITGGGLKNGDLSVVTIVNSTISGNHALVDGGGISNDGGVELRTVTIAANEADSNGDTFGEGGGLNNNTGNAGSELAQTINTIIAGNTDGPGGTAAPDCQGSDIQLVSPTLIGDTTGCAIIAGADDVTDRDAKLSALADNGGGTFTHALLAGSPAIDAGSTSGGAGGCHPSDQRGLTRSLGGRCDIGAYERVTCRGTAVNRIGTELRDVLAGTAAADGFLLFGGNDVARGMGGGDRFCGGAGNDRLLGQAGKDLLLGQGGRDRLIGGAKRDRLIGGKGRDTLIGGKGRDRCKGGPGRDLTKTC